MDVLWEFGAIITSWNIFADVTGSIVIDIWSDTYGNFPPTIAKTITGSEKPTLYHAIKNQNTSLMTFTTTVISGDIWRFNVDSIESVSRVTVAFAYTRTS
jgi:acetylornithine/succinyldiaminopimelate/putrescine aminotransferase